jgi:hypothetical protein
MGLHIKRLILGLGTAAGVLALSAPVAAQASTHPAPAVHGSTAMPVMGGQAATGTGNASKVMNVGSNGIPYTIGSCTFVVGDHREANYTASGEADIKCPAGENYRIKVYLDYSSNGQWKTATSNSASFYGAGGTYWDVWTAGMCSTTGQWANYYWVTAAEISFNGGPWYYWYYSQPNWWAIPPC